MDDEGDSEGQPSIGESFAVAAALFRGCSVVSRFFVEVMRPIVDRAPDSVPLANRQSANLLALRTDAWLRTLRKLNEPADFQAVASAGRALFEMAVDSILINSIPDAYERMMAWEQSAKLKNAQRVERHVVANAGGAPARNLAHIVEFVKKHGPGIEADRVRFGWFDKKKGKSTHPGTWTGSGDLRTDAAEADKKTPSGLVEFYDTRYGDLCFNVHGSTGAGTRGIGAEIFPALGGLVFKHCSDFAMLIAEQILRHIDRWDDAMELRLKHARTARTIVVGVVREEGLFPGSGLAILEGVDADGADAAVMTMVREELECRWKPPAG